MPLSQPTSQRPRLIDRLRRCASDAAAANPFSNAVMASPPTITVGATSAALGQNLNLTTAASQGKLLSVGGQFIAANGYLYQYAASVLPGFGNIAAGKQQQQCAIEFMTDSDQIELYFYTSGSTQCRIAIGTSAADMQYIGAGTTALTAGINEYLLINFGGAFPHAPRRIRFERDGSALALQTLSVRPQATVWKPNDADFVNAVWVWDSYGSTGATGADWPHWNMPSVASQKLGWRSTAAAVAGTGYNTNPASNLTYGQRLSDLLLQPFDVAVYCSGPNEPTTGNVASAGLQAAALACWQGARLNLPTQPIIVLGAFPGASGPSLSRINVENTIFAAFQQWADSNSVFIPVSTDTAGAWISGTGKVGATTGTGNSDFYTASDGVHPQLPAGTFPMADRIAAAIRSYLNSQ